MTLLLIAALVLQSVSWPYLEFVWREKDREYASRVGNCPLSKTYLIDIGLPPGEIALNFTDHPDPVGAYCDQEHGQFIKLAVYDESPSATYTLILFPRADSVFADLYDWLVRAECDIRGGRIDWIYWCSVPERLFVTVLDSDSGIVACLCSRGDDHWAIYVGTPSDLRMLCERVGATIRKNAEQKAGPRRPRAIPSRR